MKKMIITCAVSGAETTRKQQPALPITPEEIAEDARQCYEAGASIVHLHVRNDDGTPTSDLKVFKKTMDLIRAKTDMVLELTTGGAVGQTAEERIKVVSLEPEMASLDCGTINFGNDYIINSLPDLRMFASEFAKYKVRPTLECMDISHVQTSRMLIKEGLIKPPFYYGLGLGIPGALDCSIRSMANFVAELPPDAYFTFIGIGGKNHLPSIYSSVAHGGFIRVGFEDNIYYSKGRLAKSNAELVERAVRIAHEFGYEIAKPSDVREMFQLR
ncbi:MAG: 3-keto-5-aminohexanoate cleavage protein [Elusimicrobiales bacterium]|nr:3-keto-5-aminohexanoate cleavage protein [Elusimicrobiales bacterium]MCR4820465.1 3-keto-5-aminohexanoate cleavage protein [Elusimicrobiales bacterium]